MTNEQPDQENPVTPKGAVEVDEEKLDEAAGGSLNFGQGKTVKIDFCKTDPAVDDPTDATFTERPA